MTLRTRLALVFTLLVGCTLILVGTSTYRLLRHGLLTEIERDVARRAAVFALSHPSPPYTLDVFAAPDVFLQVVDGSGRPLAGSGNLGRRTLPLSPNARAGHVVEARVAGRPLYLTAAPLPQGRLIIVARSPVTIYAALRELRSLLVAVISAALLLTATLGWLFARSVVRPIERVVAAASAVKQGRDLGQRVAYTGPPDEIGRLAATFNAMLAELEEAYKNLDLSNQRLRQFLADCAHELRAPLTLILSNLDVLARVGPNDPAFGTQALADIHSEASRMARMITQLLILGRADAGTPMTAEPVLLADVLTDACRQGRGMAESMPFLFTIHDELDGVTVRGNADYLKQVVLILVDNAIKYTTPGGEIRVDATLTGEHARVTVSDTGSGIDPADVPRIFDRFFRGKNARGTTGTGLGLSIARWVTEQHGGRIEIDTAPGTGTRVTVVLPVLARPVEVLPGSVDPL
jgi:two-component system, OmpR family, sensor kinase